jgi:outer membrane protein OmpA-like peptidoglycan-associated protein
MRMKISLTLVVLSLGLLYGQAPNPTQTRSTSQNQVVTLESQPLYRVTVVSRTAKAVNYRHRSGATKIDFKGTALMPEARGEAKVESKQGYIEIEVEFDDINRPASQFGPEYLTYVMWAISPEGRATNLGEVLLNGTESKLNVTTELQSFGLVVTAEPYFAVSQPSDVVVMENVIRTDTRGKVDVIDAKYELLQRGQYTFNVDKSAVRSVATDARGRAVPLELLEARNAVQIARWAGADKYATDTFNKAQQSLVKAEDYYRRNEKRPTAMIAREAVQTAEDARLITLKRIEEERLANERRAAAEREAAERAKAEEAARLRAQADEQRRLEEQRRAAAEEERRRAEIAAQAEAQRRAQAETAAAQAQAATLEAHKARAAAEAERLAAERAKTEADAARQAALVEQQRLAQLAEQSKLAAAEAERARLTAEQDKENLRRQLLEQFNMILQTRDTARGLIVNMSDVLFDTAKYTLRPAAREKLARVSGIIISHPGLRIEIEGHTDSVGSDEYNQKLSEQRANAVREYLMSQGMNASIVTAKGLGETMPVASNDNAAGRQQNRRVELVVSGEVIGTKITEIHSSTIPRPQN